MNAVDGLVDLILKTSGKNEKTYSYDTEGVVQRVEDGIAYVRIGESLETPAKMSVAAVPGERVRVRVSNNRAYLVGNTSEPPTGDRAARVAYTQATEAKTNAAEALTVAQGAQESADIAADAASRAQVSADNAETDARRANVAANNAELDALRANTSANNALIQASIVEDVAGTVRWISEHGSYVPTTDTTVQNGTIYFIYNSITGDYEPIATPDPNANPSSEGWYVLDITDSQSEYIMAHIAVTSRGLWVLPSGLKEEQVTPAQGETVEDAKARLGSNYKVLLSSDGMYVYDGNGALVSKYGESISFSSTRAQYIGNENAYVVFNPANGGSITIGGANITLGDDRTLDEVIADINGIANNTLIYDHSYEYNYDSNNEAVSATFTAFLYRGGVDVKTEFGSDKFTWYLKREDDTTGEIIEEYKGEGYTCTFNLADCGYGAEVIGKFSMTDNSNALDVDYDQLLTTSGDPISVRASGDAIRVRDLTVSTTLQPTDKVMIVGAEDEHLATLQTLEDYLSTRFDKQILFGTTAEWNAQITTSSESDKLYIYTDYQTDSQGRRVAGIKVGDGNAYVVDLPFIDEVYMEHISDTTIHVTAEEKAFWNNKLNCYYGGELLTLNRL